MSSECYVFFMSLPVCNNVITRSADKYKYISNSVPDLPPVVNALILPLSVAYITLMILNWLFPQIDTKGRNIMTYITDKTSSTIDKTNYVQVLPIFIVVIMLFMFVVSKF